jgi:hypothetical protein
MKIDIPCKDCISLAICSNRPNIEFQSEFCDLVVGCKILLEYVNSKINTIEDLVSGYTTTHYELMQVKHEIMRGVDTDGKDSL